MRSTTKFLLPLLFLTITQLLFAQSKKELNQQLNTALATRVSRYESMQKGIGNLTESLKKAQSEANIKYNEYDHLRNQEKSRNETIKNNRELLNSIGGNADTIVSLKDLGLITLQSPKISDKYTLKPSSYSTTVKLVRVEEMQNISELKLKEQNALLQQKISVYDSINKLNLQILNDANNQISAFNEMKDAYSAASKSYIEFNKQLDIKIDALAYAWFKQKEIVDQKERQAEEKRMRELAAKQKKQKPGIIQFVPPVIINDDEVGLERPVFSKDLRVREFEAKQEFYGTIPEPIVKPEPEKKPEPPVICEVVEVSPEFPGGTTALYEYLKNKMIVPEKVKSGEISGRVYLKFVISASGNISNVKITKGIPDCPECDTEAVRLVKAMPNWTPGKNNGKPVNMYYNLPVKFSSN